MYKVQMHQLAVDKDQDHFRRILGYIPAVSKHKSRSRQILINTCHINSVMAHQDALEGEGEEDSGICKAQDLHTMLDTILASYVKLQNTGFIWSLHYRKNGMKM